MSRNYIDGVLGSTFGFAYHRPEVLDDDHALKGDVLAINIAKPHDLPIHPKNVRRTQHMISTMLSHPSYN